MTSRYDDAVLGVQRATRVFTPIEAEMDQIWPPLMMIEQPVLDVIEVDASPQKQAAPQDEVVS